MTAEQELAIYRAVFVSRNDKRRMAMAVMIAENGGDEPVNRHFGTAMRRTAQRIKVRLARYGIFTKEWKDMEKIEVKAAREFGCLTGKFKPTPEQKKLKARTGSIYRRDEVTEEYKYSTGEYV